MSNGTNNTQNSGENGNTDLTGLINEDQLIDTTKGQNNQSNTTNTQNNGTNDTNNQGNQNNQPTKVEIENVKYAIDKDGNATDKDGKVFKTKVELEALKNAAPPVNVHDYSEVEIENVKYSINKEGNAVDKDGKVIKTKAELEALIKEQQNEPPPLVQTIVEKSGRKFLDSKGQPKVYEDTEEGILQLANDIAEQKAAEVLQKRYELRPDVKEYEEFIERGGNPAEFHKKKAEGWVGKKFSEDEAFLTSAIVSDLMKAGMPKEQAEATAKLYKDTDKLKEFGKPAFERLVNAEKTEKVNADKAWDEHVRKTNEAKDKYWSSVNDIVTKGNLHSINIPEAERKAFFDYIAVDSDGNGNSQATLDKVKLPTEQLLQLEYLLFKGLDLSKLIQNSANTQRTLTLRSKFTKKQSGAGEGEGINQQQFNRTSNDVPTLEQVITGK